MASQGMSSPRISNPIMAGQIRVLTIFARPSNFLGHSSVVHSRVGNSLDGHWQTHRVERKISRYT